MWVYGFTRGLRSNFNNTTRKPTISQRFFGSLANATMYFIPIFNISHIYRLLNRIEIHLRGLKKEHYKADYQEPFCGICKHTL